MPDPITLDDPVTEFAGVTFKPSVYKRPKAEYRLDDGIIDHVAIDRVLHGERVSLSFRERIAAVAVGANLGMYDYEIGNLLGCTHQAVYRTRMQFNIPSRHPVHGTRHPEDDLLMGCERWKQGKLPQGSLRITRESNS